VTLPRRPHAWYRDAPRPDRLHVALRWASAPIAAMEGLLPDGGAILDWGCGHGVLAVWAAARRRERSVVGVDIDARKVASARLAARAPGSSTAPGSLVVPPDAAPEGLWDAIVLDDVCYLMEEEHQRRLLRRACRSLLPGGRLVVKDAMGSSRWKRSLSRAQEQVAVRLVRMTTSAEGVHPPPRPMRWSRSSRRRASRCGSSPSMRATTPRTWQWWGSGPPTEWTGRADGRLPP
jgi:cyclopropane fatty-acyl-phospholipid synthase-like methyltransferase